MFTFKLQHKHLWLRLPTELQIKCTRLIITLTYIILLTLSIHTGAFTEISLCVLLKMHFVIIFWRLKELLLLCFNYFCCLEQVQKIIVSQVVVSAQFTTLTRRTHSGLVMRRLVLVLVFQNFPKCLLSIQPKVVHFVLTVVRIWKINTAKFCAHCSTVTK